VKQLEGIVKKWLDGRGFGFIEVDDSEDDVFVHHSELKGTYSLMSGQRVEFEVESSYKGPRATNVKVVG
jgi:CspA family cold shock protein